MLRPMEPRRVCRLGLFRHRPQSLVAREYKDAMEQPALQETLGMEREALVEMRLRMKPRWDMFCITHSIAGPLLAAGYDHENDVFKHDVNYSWRPTTEADRVAVAALPMPNLFLDVIGPEGPTRVLSGRRYWLGCFAECSNCHELCVPAAYCAQGGAQQVDLAGPGMATPHSPLHAAHSFCEDCLFGFLVERLVAKLQDALQGARREPSRAPQPFRLSLETRADRDPRVVLAAGDTVTFLPCPCRRTLLYQKRGDAPFVAIPDGALRPCPQRLHLTQAYASAPFGAVVQLMTALDHEYHDWAEFFLQLHSVLEIVHGRSTPAQALVAALPQDKVADRGPPYSTNLRARASKRVYLAAFCATERSSRVSRIAFLRRRRHGDPAGGPPARASTPPPRVPDTEEDEPARDPSPVVIPATPPGSPHFCDGAHRAESE